jgi:hypothetical protein
VLTVTVFIVVTGTRLVTVRVAERSSVLGTITV